MGCSTCTFLLARHMCRQARHMWRAMPRQLPTFWQVCSCMHDLGRLLVRSRHPVMAFPHAAWIEMICGLLCAGATITGGTMTVEGCGSESLQGDVRFAEVMGLMGADVRWSPYSITITGDTLQSEHQPHILKTVVQVPVKYFCAPSWPMWHPANRHPRLHGAENFPLISCDREG